MMEKFTIGFCLVMGMSLLLTFLPAALNGHWLGIVVALLGGFEIGWAVFAIATYKRTHCGHRKKTTFRHRAD